MYLNLAKLKPRNTNWRWSPNGQIAKRRQAQIGFHLLKVVGMKLQKHLPMGRYLKRHHQ